MISNLGPTHLQQVSLNVKSFWQSRPPYPIYPYA